MRPVRKSQNFQFIPLDRKFSFSDGFCFNSMCCSNVKVTAETSLKCICVYIHPGLNSCRSEFMPVWSHAGLKSVGSVQQAEWLETSPSYFRPGLMWTSVINYTLTETKWSRFDFVPVSCKRGLVVKYPLVKYPLVLFHQIPSIYRCPKKMSPLLLINYYE
jgi:hypothetical protein